MEKQLIIKEELISFETAVLAKEKGFQVPVCDYSNISEPDRIVTVGAFNHNFMKHGNVTVSRPTQALLQKWLRDVHNCIVNPQLHKEENEYNLYFYVQVDYYGKDFKRPLTDDCDYISGSYNSYEYVLEKGLLEALKLI